ncbi:MAG: hypothetical protein L3V56_02730 [Candidatus Magnetoovum sp. WYHC-5]|nr:hypothetical protein [Candidatus Magnetoovum sp. WYHC-5]
MSTEEGRPRINQKINLDKYEQIKSTLNKVKELKGKKNLLIEEKHKILHEIQSLETEIEGIDVAIATTQKQIDSLVGKTVTYKSNIDILQLRCDELTEDINRLKTNINQINEDIDNCKVLKLHIEREKKNLEMERDSAVKNIALLEDGMLAVSQRKMISVPYLTKYDELLKTLYKNFKDVQIKMEVALKINNI